MWDKPTQPCPGLRPPPPPPPELQVETWEGDRVEEGGSAKCCTYGVSGSAALPAQVRWHGLGPRRGAVRVVSQR